MNGMKAAVAADCRPLSQRQRIPLSGTPHPHPAHAAAWSAIATAPHGPFAPSLRRFPAPFLQNGEQGHSPIFPPRVGVAAPAPRPPPFLAALPLKREHGRPSLLPKQSHATHPAKSGGASRQTGYQPTPCLASWASEHTHFTHATPHKNAAPFRHWIQGETGRGGVLWMPRSVLGAG